jgi:hypothetical protein
VSANDRFLKDKVGFLSDHDLSLSDKGVSLSADDLFLSANDRSLSDDDLSPSADIGALDDQAVVCCLARRGRAPLIVVGGYLMSRTRARFVTRKVHAPVPGRSISASPDPHPASLRRLLAPAPAREITRLSSSARGTPRRGRTACRGQ